MGFKENIQIGKTGFNIVTLCFYLVLDKIYINTDKYVVKFRAPLLINPSPFYISDIWKYPKEVKSVWKNFKEYWGSPIFLTIRIK